MEIIQGLDCRFYKSANGTYYASSAPDDLLEVLEGVRLNGIRIKVHYANKTLTGRIVRTFAKFPVISYNARSLDAHPVAESRIQRIEYANKRDGGVLWEKGKQKMLVS